MTQLQTMYPGVANSPDTFLKEDLAKDATVMYLSDGSVLGKLPTLAVIGGGADAETVLVTSTCSDGGFTIQRGVEGEQKAWKKADLVARNWTNKDYEAIRANIKAVNDGKVDKVAGKGLSSNDYTDAAKKKVDGIPANPKYTDTVADLSNYVTKDLFNDLVAGFASEIYSLENAKLNKTDIVNDLTTGGVDKALSAEQGKILEDTKLDKADVKTRLADMTSDSTHRTVTDAEKKAWSEGGGIDKKYLYDILMGESLVTKKEGEWPKVYGKPTNIEVIAFRNNQITNVIIPPSVTDIGQSAFRNNHLTNVIIPPSVTSIGQSAFENNQITNVIIPPSVTSIEDSAFWNNQLTSVVIPPSVTSIEDSAFTENKLTEVKVPKNCTVADGAFDAGVNIIRY